MCFKDDSRITQHFVDVLVKIPNLQPGCVPAKRRGLHLHGFPCLCAVPGPKWGSASAKSWEGFRGWCFVGVFFGRSLCQLGKLWEFLFVFCVTVFEKNTARISEMQILQLAS